MTQEQFLLDMLEYYTVDPLNRRSVGDEGCSYSPAKPTTEGCAIGRYLIGSLEEKQQWDRDGGSYIACIDRLKYDVIPDIRPDWMKDMDTLFLRKVQSLHDQGDRWEQKGLSVKGVNVLIEIIREYKFNIPLFEKFIK